MKSKILFPILGIITAAGIIFYNPKVLSNVKSGKISASLLDDNPNKSNKKILNPFPEKMHLNEQLVTYKDVKSKYSIRELLSKNELTTIFSDLSFPKDFSCKELLQEIDLHKKNENATRYDMKYHKEVKNQDLSNYLGLYDNPFVLSQLYHRNNIILSPSKGEYLYDEHFPENQPEEQSYLVRKVNHLLPIFNNDKEIEYLHFGIYNRYVERGVYETYKNFVVKYNNNGNIEHFIKFNKNELSWVKLNYDDNSHKFLYAEVVAFYQRQENKINSNNVSCRYSKIEIKGES